MLDRPEEVDRDLQYAAAHECSGEDPVPLEVDGGSGNRGLRSAASLDETLELPEELDAVQFVAIAAAVFFFVVKPVDAMMRRYRSPAEEGMPDEERRHQELLAALAQSRAG